MTIFDCRTDCTSEFALRTSDYPRLARSRRIGSASSRCFRTGTKRIEREDGPRRVSLEVIIRGTCDRVRLLDQVEDFTLFSEHKAGLVKITGQNHLFLGVNNAIASMLLARRAEDGAWFPAAHAQTQRFGVAQGCALSRAEQTARGDQDHGE